MHRIEQYQLVKLGGQSAHWLSTLSLYSPLVVWHKLLPQFDSSLQLFVCVLETIPSLSSSKSCEHQLQCIDNSRLCVTLTLSSEFAAVGCCLCGCLCTIYCVQYNSAIWWWVCAAWPLSYILHHTMTEASFLQKPTTWLFSQATKKSFVSRFLCRYPKLMTQALQFVFILSTANIHLPLSALTRYSREPGRKGAPALHNDQPADQPARAAAGCPRWAEEARRFTNGETKATNGVSSSAAGAGECFPHDSSCLRFFTLIPLVYMQSFPVSL